MNPSTKTKLHKLMGIEFEKKLPKAVVDLVERVEKMSVNIGGAENLHPQVLALALVLSGTNTEQGILAKLFGKKGKDEPVIDYTSLTNPELRKLCKERDLDTAGKKDDLVTKLVAYDRISGGE